MPAGQEDREGEGGLKGGCLRVQLGDYVGSAELDP